MWISLWGLCKQHLIIYVQVLEKMHADAPMPAAHLNTTANNVLWYLIITR